MDARQRSSGLVKGDFMCGVCKDVLLAPCTLTCGHNFCQHCLYQALYEVDHLGYAVLRSQADRCPLCRSSTGLLHLPLPKVNGLLRDIVEERFSSRLRERERECKDELEKARLIAQKTRRWLGEGHLLGLPEIWIE